MRTAYLKAYNLILAMGWLVLLVYWSTLGGQLDRFGLLLLNVCQGAAVLEIIHVAVGGVRSSIFNTALQVASRIFVVVLVDLLPAGEYLSLGGLTGLHLILIAWSITEVVRYSYYFTNLMGRESASLRFCRYTFFIVLYPLGVVGEALIIFSVIIEWRDLQLDWINGLLAAVFLLYFVFFPRLYGYMWRQRGKKLL